MQSSVGAEILGGAPVREGEGDVLASGDGHAIVRGRCHAAAHIGRVIQAVGIGPIIGEQRDGVGDNGRRRVRSGVAAAGPEGIGRTAVVVALDVDGIFRCHGESALIVVGADGEIAARSVAASGDQFQNVARARDRVGQTRRVAAGGLVRVEITRVYAEAVADVLGAPVVEAAVLIHVFRGIGVVGLGLQCAVGIGGGQRLVRVNHILKAGFATNHVSGSLSAIGRIGIGQHTAVI